MRGEVFASYSADKRINQGNTTPQSALTRSAFLCIYTGWTSAQPSFSYAISAYRQKCAMEHTFVLYASAKESLNVKSLPVNLQENIGFILSFPGILHRRLTFWHSTNWVPSPVSLYYDFRQSTRSGTLGCVLWSRYSLTDGCDVIDCANLRIIVPDIPEAYRGGKIKNVVYSDVFSWPQCIVSHSKSLRNRWCKKLKCDTVAEHGHHLVLLYYYIKPTSTTPLNVVPTRTHGASDYLPSI